MKKRMKYKVISVLLFVVMLVAVACAMTVTGSGFLDLSNIAQYIFIGIALICGIAGVVLWRMSGVKK